MTRDEAFRFLETHQPLPADRDLDESVISQFDEVRRFFAEHPDPACVPLFLKAFGVGSGFGVYQLVEDTLRKQDNAAVIKELSITLRSSNSNTRTWSAEIAAGFPHENLVKPLVAILSDDDFDIKYAALTALEQVGSRSALTAIKKYALAEDNVELRGLAEEIVGKLEA